MACKLKKGMIVTVLSGKHRHKQGKILRLDAAAGRVIVEGVNMIKRATRPNRQNPQGGFVEKEAALALSNVAALDPDTKKPCRVRFETRDGRKVRVSHRSGKVVEP